MSIKIQVDHDPRLQLATQQLRHSLVREVSLHNTGEDTLRELEIQVEFDPAVGGSTPVRLLRLDPDERVRIDHERFGIHLSTERLVNQTEREVGSISVKVKSLNDDQLLATHRSELEILAYNEWVGGEAPPEVIASFVTPNHPDTKNWLEAVRDELEKKGNSRSLEGYQGNDTRRVAEICAAIYRSVGAFGIDYAMPPTSFEKHGQKVRTIDEVRAEKMGTCLDLTLVMATLMEKAGLHPLIVLIEGHAFPAVWLTDFKFPTPWVDDPLAIRKRIQLGECLAFDSSAAANGVPFGEACDMGMSQLSETDSFIFAVDVATARKRGVHPLNLQRQRAWKATEVESEVTFTPDSDMPFIPTTLSEPASDAEFEGLDQLGRWKSHLLDLTLRNRLLNHRETNSVLPLLTTEVGKLEDLVFSQNKCKLTERPNKTRPDDDFVDFADSELEEGRLLTDLTTAEFQKRVLQLYRDTQSMLRDTGTCPLYLTLGMLEWFESDSSDQPRYAPIILLPVTLERGSVNGPFYLKTTEDEAMLNVTLLRKLEVDFGVQFPKSMYEALPTDDAGIDVDDILRSWLHLVKDLRRFDVKWQASVAVYNFKKFLMWLDLEQNTEALQSNSVVQHLLTEGGAERFLETSMPHPDELDDERARADDLSVMESDASQLAATFSALEGNSFVLQGPPGTGKSQTITNLVAQALARGKTVLFVSEKRAALEVVEKRLKEVGLGPFALEVHSDKASKSAVVKQLQEPLAYEWASPDQDWQRVAARLESKRTTLNAHVARMHRAGPFGDSLFQAVSRLCGLRNVPDVRLVFESFPDQEGLAEQRSIVAQFRVATDVVGVPEEHTWCVAQTTMWNPELGRKVGNALDKLEATGHALKDSLDAYRETILQSKATIDGEGLERTEAMLDLVTTSPAPPEALLTIPFAGVDQALADASPVLQRRQRELANAMVVFDESVFETNVREMQARVAKWREAFFLLAFVMLFFVRRSLKVHAKNGLPGNDKLHDALQAATNAKQSESEIAPLESDLKSYFGHHWRGHDTDPERLTEVWEWTRSFRNELVGFEERFGEEAARSLRSMAVSPSERLTRSSKTGAVILKLGERLESWRQTQTEFATTVDAKPPVFDLSTSHEQRLDTIAAWKTSIPKLRDWCDWRRAALAMHEAGFGAIVDRTWTGELSGEVIGLTYERALRQAWFESKLASDEHLARFRGHAHEQVIAEFRQQDEEAQTLARKEIQARLAARLPEPGAPGEMEVLRREFKKKRAHKPLRQLFAEVPTVLLRLKPCVLMSPLSVARFLDPDADLFDLVVFDEASQIPPWDAVGALGRAKQAIVVGDSRQLPPTSFFSSGTSEDDLLEEDQVDMESILDQCIATGMPEMTLNWHYRSQHEDLIAFSNYHYYDNRLHIFPSPHADVPELGVNWVYVDNGYYDRGGSRTNEAEAVAIVNEVVMRLCDEATRDLSIGIVTFSQAQQKCVEDLMDRARRKYPEIEKYFGDGVAEPVFVKNLENVQGDERDVMLFSICYGPDAAGKVTMGFGPLNKAGGERRLNVAVTRARRLLTVFSTLRADQIDLSRTNAVGVKHLKRFLDYAARGPETLEEAISLDADHGFESPLEKEIAEAIEADGWTVRPQVGVAGYRIDLGVVHPDHAGAFVLGIEADGAAYHSSRSARDRDRLRQAVLENLGWTIHRVWSTDWWHDPEGETQKILDAIRHARTAWEKRKAIEQMKAAQRVEIPSVLPERIADDDFEALVDEGPRWPDWATPWKGLPAIEAGDQDQFYSDRYEGNLARMFCALVERTQPVQAEVVAKHLIYSWDFKSASSKAVERVLEVGRRSGLVVIEEDIVWTKEADRRNWRGIRYVDGDTPDRDFMEIPGPELECAIRWVVSRAIGIDADAVALEVARIFGKSQTGKRIRERCEQTVDRLVQKEILESQEGRLRVAEPS